MSRKCECSQLFSFQFQVVKIVHVKSWFLGITWNMNRGAPQPSPTCTRHWWCCTFYGLPLIFTQYNIVVLHLPLPVNEYESVRIALQQYLTTILPIAVKMSEIPKKTAAMFSSARC